MSDLASKLLHRLGFVRIGAVDTAPLAVDLSASVELSGSGQASIPVETVMDTKSFQRDLAILEEIASAHRQGSSGR